ncbi:hypothetical protein LSTR_LSTR002891 [Laodelphax striatellus]|uniref:Importin-7/11-like TPR repeats domain-containing protein n=1 Tax=Laodelphax striatellus TaxID=195883 RepID=A0A482XW58_LAOST|nr:hypothetical protein LSTR_LSTR002891 [Laodelphax striatellus]
MVFIFFSLPVFLHPLRKPLLPFFTPLMISYRDEKCLQTLEKASLLLKSLHKLTVHGFVKIHESPDANAFLHSIFGYTKTMLEQHINESAENSKYSLRPCAESLFLAFFYEYKSVLSPLLVELVESNHAPVPSHLLPAILAKDAVYNAVGLAAFELYDQDSFFFFFFFRFFSSFFSFSSFPFSFSHLLLLHLFARHLRPALYVAMLALLHCGEDCVVRLTAANTVKVAVDDFDFSSEQFAEFLEPFFTLLFALLKDVHECESKMQVLYILSFIIERMGNQITPYSQGLIQYLPFLWYESNDHNMLRCAIVSTLMRLVQALGTWENHNLQRILFPVIQLSTDISQPAHVYLLEDGLELWVAVIENATCMTPDLLMLFKNMLPLLDGSSEYLKSCLLIIEAYIILEPDSVMQNFGDGLIRSFNSMMRDMSNDGITQIMNVMEVFLKAKPGRAVNVIKPALPMVFEAIVHGQQLPFLMASFLSVMARVILIRNDVFLEVMIDYSQSRGLKVEEVFGEFLDSWLQKMEIVTQFEKEKLLALALASMLSSPDREVLHRFCPFLFALKEVMNDIAECQNEDGSCSLLIVGNDLPEDSEDDEELSSKHRKRKRQLALSDPVYTCNLMAYVRDQVNNLRLRLNAEQFQDVMQTVDDETLENIRQFVPL